MSALWDWAATAYGRPGAEPAALALQDEHGVSVPLLFWVLWSQAQGRTPDFQAGAELARTWETEAVGPLRKLRRALKALGEDPDREAVRDQVRAVEFDAERRLLSALERVAPRPGPPASPSEMLAQAAHVYGVPLEPDAFAPLLRALNPGAF
jgi:uncharacterized protein (TIGR02444 family)